MKVYYIEIKNGKKYGSRNRAKIEAMYPEQAVLECDIADFHGHLYSNDWAG